jgi:hypothetical protein
MGLLAGAIAGGVLGGFAFSHEFRAGRYARRPDELGMTLGLLMFEILFSAYVALLFFFLPSH